MTVQFTIKPEVQVELQAQARGRGMSIDEYVLSVLESLVPRKEFDLDALLALPRKEQSRILRQASSRAAPEYTMDMMRPPLERELTAFTALDDEDFMDEPA